MNIQQFLQRIINNETVAFREAIEIIEQYYDYRPAEFTNGVTEPLINPPGKNEGSCKIFAFAKLHELTPTQTLRLFGEFYQDVLNTPEGNDHQNIRKFMRDGWEGITFSHSPLTGKDLSGN